MIKNQQWMINMKLSFKIIHLTFCDLTCCTQNGIQNGCQIITCLALCFSRSIKWLLKQVIFHNNLMGSIKWLLKQVIIHNSLMGKDIKPYMIPKVIHTVGSKCTLSYINSMTPFEIKYQLRAILWKIMHLSDTYLSCNCADCLIPTSKSISLKCVVSDCVYVFKKVSKMSTKWFIHCYISIFIVHYYQNMYFLGGKITYWPSCFWDAYIFYIHNMSINKTPFWEQVCIIWFVYWCYMMLKK